MSRKHVPAAALLAMVALSTGTAHGATATQRTEARRVLAPLDRVSDAVDKRGTEMLRRGNEWSATVAPCITAGYAQIEAAVAAGTIPADEKAGYASDERGSPGLVGVRSPRCRSTVPSRSTPNRWRRAYPQCGRPDPPSAGARERAVQHRPSSALTSRSR